MKKNALLILSSLLLLPNSLYALSLEGKISHLVDGDTFDLSGQRIRLLGIDTPENAQICLTKNNRQYYCGDEATRFLQKMVQGKMIQCEGEELDSYKRLLATCYVGEININKALVRAGWAVAFVKYDKRYLPFEQQAMSDHLGMWQGDFLRPAIYRQQKWEQAGQGETAGMKPNCPIKGNINRKGQKIYHTPWSSRSYSRTRINLAKGEQWFCSENEALEAGWRPPYR